MRAFLQKARAAKSHQPENSHPALQFCWAYLAKLRCSSGGALLTGGWLISSEWCTGCWEEGRMWDMRDERLAEITAKEEQEVKRGSLHTPSVHQKVQLRRLALTILDCVVIASALLNLDGLISTLWRSKLYHCFIYFSFNLTVSAHEWANWLCCCCFFKCMLLKTRKEKGWLLLDKLCYAQWKERSLSVNNNVLCFSHPRIKLKWFKMYCSNSIHPLSDTLPGLWGGLVSISSGLLVNLTI